MNDLVPILLGFLFLASCGTQQNQKPAENDKVVLISKFYPNNDYQRWLAEADSTLLFYQAYGMSKDSLAIVLQKADAILLTGGKDIDPSYTGKDSLRYLCGATDPYRDSLENELIDFAFVNDVVLFGGCRGMQIINASRGGSLIVDIPLQRGSTLHQQDEGDAHHALIDVGLSDFLEVEFPTSTQTNSNHHQAIDVLANGFEVLAFSEDSIIEAIRWKDTAVGPVVFCWQWHPERMGREEPYAKSLRDFVISTVQPEKTEVK